MSGAVKVEGDARPSANLRIPFGLPVPRTQPREGRGNLCFRPEDLR